MKGVENFSECTSTSDLRIRIDLNNHFEKNEFKVSGSEEEYRGVDGWVRGQ